MISEPYSFLTGISTITNIVKKLIEISKDASIKEKSVELLSVITDLQSEMLFLQSQYQETLNELSILKEKLKEYEEWNEIESLYQPKQINTGVFVYESKTETDDNSNYHWLCSNCFNNKEKSFLQNKKVMGNTMNLFCPKCQNTFIALFGKSFKSLYEKMK